MLDEMGQSEHNSDTNSDNVHRADDCLKKEKELKEAKDSKMVLIQEMRSNSTKSKDAKEIDFGKLINNKGGINHQRFSLKAKDFLVEEAQVLKCKRSNQVDNLVNPKI